MDSMKQGDRPETITHGPLIVLSPLNLILTGKSTSKSKSEHAWNIPQQYVEGFRPEWCISTIYHAWDAPFWSWTFIVYMPQTAQSQCAPCQNSSICWSTSTPASLLFVRFLPYMHFLTNMFTALFWPMPLFTCTLLHLHGHSLPSMYSFLFTDTCSLKHTFLTCTLILIAPWKQIVNGTAIDWSSLAFQFSIYVVKRCHFKLK